MPESIKILVVRLERPDLSLGQLGLLLQDLQVAVRSTATAIDRPPPVSSVRASDFKQKSLEFVIEVLGWTPAIAEDTAVAIVHVVRSLAEAVGIAVAFERIWAFVRRRHGTPDEPGEISRHLEGIEEVRDRRERAVLIRRVSSEYRADARRVEAGVSAVEAAARSIEAVQRSGGGYIVAPEPDARVEIPPRQWPPREISH